MAKQAIAKQRDFIFKQIDFKIINGAIYSMLDLQVNPVKCVCI